jgi:hypothetical protein
VSRVSLAKRHDDRPRDDAKFIIKPLVFHDTKPTGYGAGQPTVVVRDGKLLMWYTDDSESPDVYATMKFMLESDDPVTWAPSPDKRIGLSPQDGIDVKYDVGLQQFVMTYIAPNASTQSRLYRSYSSNGSTWSSSKIVIGAHDFPTYTI